MRQGVGRPQQLVQAQKDPHWGEAAQMSNMFKVRGIQAQNHIFFTLTLIPFRRFIQRYNMKQHYKTHKFKKPLLIEDKTNEIT